MDPEWAVPYKGQGMEASRSHVVWLSCIAPSVFRCKTSVMCCTGLLIAISQIGLKHGRERTSGFRMDLNLSALSTRELTFLLSIYHLCHGQGIRERRRKNGPVPEGDLLCVELSTDMTVIPGGPQPHPLRLVMHLPAANGSHLNLQGKRANHVNSRPLTSLLGYNSVWNRVRGYFPEAVASVLPGLPRADAGWNLGPPVRRRTP